MNKEEKYILEWIIQRKGDCTPRAFPCYRCPLRLVDEVSQCTYRLPASQWGFPYIYKRALSVAMENNLMDLLIKELL